MNLPQAAKYFECLSSPIRLEIFSLLIRYGSEGRSSRPEELPLKALTEPDVNLSAHPAPPIEDCPHSNFQCANNHVSLRAIRARQCSARLRCLFSRFYFIGKAFAVAAAILPSVSPLTVVASSPAQWGKPFAPGSLLSFFATTACSAPVLRIGTLALMGPPLALLPSHRSDRFPRSTQEPDLTSRRFYAGCHAGSKQVASCTYPTGTTPPWF